MQYYQLHLEHDAIVRGQHRVAFRWPVVPTDKVLGAVESPECIVVLNVEPATDGAVARFREVVRAGFRDGEPAAWRHAMAHSVGGAHDRRLVRLYFQLLDDAVVPPNDCANIIYELTKFATVGSDDASPEVQRALAEEAVEYLAGRHPRHAVEVLNQMLGRWGPAGFRDALGGKFNDMHPLVRAACAASIPSLLDEGHEKKLLAELAGLYRRPTPETIQGLIGQLNDDAFRVRERATANLRRIGPPALGPLKAKLAKPLSAEVDRRVRTLVEEIAKDDRPEARPLEASALQHLQSADTPRSMAMIGAIARNTADPWMVREAREYYERWK